MVSVVSGISQGPFLQPSTMHTFMKMVFGSLERRNKCTGTRMVEQKHFKAYKIFAVTSAVMESNKKRVN